MEEEHKLRRSQIEEIELDLTGTCNLRCPICTRNFIHAQEMVVKNVRPFNEIKAQLDSFTGLKRFFIAGAVSEPTLYPQFFEFIEYLNSRSIMFELFTNGSTHDREWWKTLGNLVQEKCMTCFTVCGSTQQMHERYRIGSSLEMILKNAEAYRQNQRKNDWIQTIRFEYNRDDIESRSMHEIIDQFSHHMQVDSEGMRRLNDKVVEQDEDINPVKKRNDAIKYIFSKMRTMNRNTKIYCKSFEQRKLYIDQFGNVAPCYISAEFEKGVFERNSESFDYTKILDHCYQDCFLCSEFVNDMICKLNLGFVC